MPPIYDQIRIAAILSLALAAGLWLAAIWVAPDPDAAVGAAEIQAALVGGEGFEPPTFSV